MGLFSRRSERYETSRDKGHCSHPRQKPIMDKKEVIGAECKDCHTVWDTRGNR